MAESVESLNSALDNIQSDRLKDREKGLSDLRYALTLNRGSPALGKSIKDKSIQNKSIHSACEKLFQIVSSERATYVRATKSTSKSSSSTRLASCASTIRLMVEVFVTSMRLKTVQAIVGHITQALPTADGGFCTPLAVDFFKALKAILDYQPHVEHLDHDTWSDLVGFCVNGLELYGEDIQSVSTTHGNGKQHGTDSSSRAISFATGNKPSRDVTDGTVELVGCLRSLTMASNCPLVQKAPEIFHAITKFISYSISTTTAHHAAFEAINACLRVMSTQSRRRMTWALTAILPSIGNLWSKRNPALRDEMLVTLVHSKAHLASLGQEDQSETLLPILESLLDTMSAEYSESRDRGHLTLDQLALHMKNRPHVETMPMQYSTFSLRRSTKETEHNWTVLYFLGFFTNWVDAQRRFYVDTSSGEEERSPKRRRISSRLLDLANHSANSSSPDKLTYNLQVMAFAISQRSLSEAEWASISDFLNRNAVHENSDTSSWALMNAATCAVQLDTDHTASHEVWLNLWHLAIRLVSSIPHTRAACHVLDALLCTRRLTIEGVADSIDTLVSSINLNGPALVSDSALSMWLTFLELRSATSPAQQGDVEYGSMLEWLCSKWRPSDFENRSYSYQLSRDSSTKDIATAFASIISQRLICSSSVTLASLGTIGEPWLFQWRNKPLLDYLLLKRDVSQPSRLVQFDHLDTRIHMAAKLDGQIKFGTVLLRFLLSEAEKTLKAWLEIRENRPSTINEDMLNVIFSFCVLGTIISHTMQSTQKDRTMDLQLKFNNLAKDVLAFASKTREVGKISTLLHAISPVFPQLSDVDAVRDLYLIKEPMDVVLNYLSQTLEFYREDSETTLAEYVMDLDDLGFVTEPKDSKKAPISRRQDSACCSGRSFIDSAACYVNFLCNWSHNTVDATESTVVSSEFVHHVMSLDSEELTSSRPFIKVMLSSKFELRAQDAGDLLKHLYSKLLNPYEWNRCEVALGICMDVMTGTAHLWTDSNLASDAGLGAQLYQWFVETALENGILSTESQLGIADLLNKLLDVNPSYAEDASKPSVRTRLFQILKNGNLIVQYHISQRLVNVFNSFILSQHELIFDDIFESLPTELEHQEGIYVRMLVFTQIGSIWKSLLRRCLFHILETAGLVPESVPHAKYCIQLITEALSLPDARCVFRLFSPQLLHTWLELHPLKTIAFPIFGYSSLKAMLEDAKSQFLSQLLMIGSAEKLSDFETELSSNVKDVLITSFGQAAAYGIAQDLSMHGPGGVHSHATEARIRDTLGKHQYLELLASELPNIMGHLFVRLEQEEHIERTLAKRPEYGYAANTLNVIKGLGHSTILLSQTQQPSFKLKLLLEEIDRICRRISKKPAEIWSAPLVLKTARMLFEDANEAFGPLHACRTIQRLRLLVCLAGMTCITGYPLEMMIHALRPFLTNKQCADDAIGLFQYLMESGKDHLVQNPRLVGGTSLTLMLSLRNFLNSTQDSTTQGAQHRATLSKAQTFRSWLGQYMDLYNPTNLSAGLLRRLRAMVSAAQLISGPGGATVDTQESRLLLSLLDDIKDSNQILGEKFGAECIELFCRDFAAPSSFREDVLGADTAATYYAPAIWKTLRNMDSSSSYLQWAMNALGRGFGYDGLVDPDIIRETNLKELGQLHQGAKSQRHASTSKVSIIEALVETLWDSRPVVVGLAETALQKIVSRYKGSDDVFILAQALPSTIVDNFSAVEYDNQAGASSDCKGLSQCSSKMNEPFKEWIKELAAAISLSANDEPVLGTIVPLLKVVDGLAEKLFPFIVHASLAAESNVVDGSPHGEQLSQYFNRCITVQTNQSRPHVKTLLNAALFLRTQPKPQERTSLDRNEWLALDLAETASAANHCEMYKSALLLIELGQTMDSRGSSTRKSSVINTSRSRAPVELMVSIFRELEEPDSFYGVEQESDLGSIAARLDYEGDNIQSLLLRGAKMDSQLREKQEDHSAQQAAIIRSLGKLGLNSITSSLASTQRQTSISGSAMDIMTNSAMKLRQWDVVIPSSNPSPESLVYRTFQSIQSFADLTSARTSARDGLSEVLERMKDVGWAGPTIPRSFRALSALTEMTDMLATQGSSQFFETWQKLLERDSWIKISRADNVSLLLTSRETFCGILSHNTSLQDALGISAKDSRLIEVYVDLHAAETHRKLGSLQESLSTAAYLSSLSKLSKERLRLSFDASVMKETAEILWQRGQLASAIKTLQDISNAAGFEDQTVPVGGAGLLADIAHRVSYARLEKPDDILSNYLQPALRRLKTVRQGPEAGKVFHEYATYCHKQLDNPDGIEELRRSERFKRQRTAELQDLKTAALSAKNEKEKTAARKEYENVRRWLKIDEQETQRLRQAREQFLESSLEHYLRSLAASDEFDTDVIRFLAIWLRNSENSTANKPVKEYQSRVPSKKFTSLMNQLGSRLQESDSEFQSILGSIIMRICQDHPYHGMYHIFAGSKTSGGNDSQARSRKSAASKIAKRLEKNQNTGAIWSAVHRSNELYNRMAKLRSEETKQGAKLTMKQFESSKSVEREVPTLNIPPVTMSIGIRDDLNYNDLPTVVGFRPEITIPSGISAPKIITALASNGVRYRQLFKGGTDDLRQDAIMEQVFEQVTSLLKTNKATRQRGLAIRTYKVVPLDATSGAIEFVEPTTSLNDFLVDAHQRYNPKDLKWKACRDKMGEVADLDLSARLREFQNIKSRFRPVLRHFFLERFEDPDEWFERRLAYTRSSAAISILGHVLGLGDRHCQNILIDTQTGEVVHIDLGVAFEAGRILPKPETVPFRLTRDIIDGFGILKTEGVFRRCCEFTLEALRENKDTILTLLNVLRYDPLYSWSVSPLRAKRLQDEQESRMAEVKAGSVAVSRAASRRSSAAAQDGINEEAEILKEKQREDEGGEADRALSTVQKKLAAGLSVSATVNELIQQATDDKNLAVLFHGWAPYA